MGGDFAFVKHIGGSLFGDGVASCGEFVNWGCKRHGGVHLDEFVHERMFR